MSTKGVGGSKLDWKPWQDLATEVQKAKSDTTQRDADATSGSEAAKPSEAPQTALTRRMREVLSSHPELAKQDAAKLEVAAATAQQLDAVYAPLTQLAQGLENIAKLKAKGRHTSLYPNLMSQMAGIDDLRAAIEAAGSAITKFPTAQLDALEKAVRQNLAAIVETQGVAARYIAPEDLRRGQVFDDEALQLFQGLETALATLYTQTPHELFDEPIRRNFDGKKGTQHLCAIASRTLGGPFGMPGVFLPAIAGPAIEGGKPITAKALVDALLAHDPNNVLWGDVLHAYLKSAHPDLEVERRPRPKTLATLLTPRALQALNLVRKGYAVGNAARGPAGLDAFAKFSEAHDGRALTPEDFIEVAAGLAPDDQYSTALVNGAAIQMGLDPIVGIPKDILSTRNEFDAATKTASGEVEGLGADLATLASTLGQRRADIQGAQKEALEALTNAKPGDIPAIVDQARAVLDEAQKDAAGYRRELGQVFNVVTERLADVQDLLRTKERAFRTTIAKHQGVQDMSGQAGLGRELVAIEQNALGRMTAVFQQIQAIEGGQTGLHVRAQVGAIEADITNALVAILRKAAQITKGGDLERAAEAAAAKAETKRAEMTSAPLTAERLLELPYEDLGAYRLTPDVMQLLARLRSARLPEPVAKRALESWLKIDESSVTVQKTGLGFANAVFAIEDLKFQVGVSVSPTEGARRIDANMARFNEVVQGEADRALLKEYVAGLTSGLRSM